MSEVGFKRLTIVFISLISLTAILIWAALIIRAGDVLKVSSMGYDGNLLYSFVMIFTFPLLHLSIGFGRTDRVRMIMLGVMIVGGIISLLLAWNYLQLFKTNPNDPYSVIDQFLEQNFILVVVHNGICFSLFILSTLLTVIPIQNLSPSKEVVIDVGVGVPSPMSIHESYLIGELLGGGIILAAVLLWVIHVWGLLGWLLGIYGVYVFISFLLWWSTQGQYKSAVKDSRQVDPKQLHFFNIFFGFSLGIAIIVGIAIYEIHQITLYIDIGLILGICIFLGLARLLGDNQFRPQRKSDFESRRFYHHLLGNSMSFGVYNLFSGTLILTISAVYFINADRTNILLAWAELLLIIGAAFFLTLIVISVFTPKILIVIANLCILTALLLNLELINNAINSMNWAIPFLQSWGSAVLCGFSIGILLGFFMDAYLRYYHETKQLGAHLEIALFMMFLLLILGAILGMQLTFNGMTNGEILANAQTTYEELSIAFIVVICFTLLAVIWSGILTVKQLNAMTEKASSEPIKEE